jgi:hypothetical protein
MISKIAILVDLFVKTAMRMNRKGFLQSLAQNISARPEFAEAKKFLQLAKDLITPSVRARLGQSFGTQLQDMSGSIDNLSSLKKQIDAVSAIQDYLFKGTEGSQEPKEQMLNQRAVSIGSYLASAKENYTRLSSAEGTSSKQLQTNEDKWMSRQELLPPGEKDVPSHTWVGPIPKNINPETQKALNKLLSLSLKTDGILGPLTASALQMFKNKYNSPKNIYDPSLWEDIIFAASGEWEKQFGKELEHI